MADSHNVQKGHSRIGVFLPVNSVQEILAAQQVMEVVRRNYNGATQSLCRPHVFDGFWLDDTDPQSKFWVWDKICWLVVDVPYSMNSTEIDTDVELITLEVLELYKQARSPQKEVAISVHPIWWRSDFAQSP